MDKGACSLMDNSLILLMGLPRSGTTWIAKMFDSHPRTVYLHEADRGEILRSMPLAPDVSDAQALRPVTEAFAHSLLKIRDTHVLAAHSRNFERTIGRMLRRQCIG